ncbi:hypothetical protein M0R45_019356 [Rubus argutus]|uniref:Uncharacterized protein n=1 Tax=Rubus argutus TaxID=59490 RepID=A0AAW1X752_RUBAR
MVQAFFQMGGNETVQLQSIFRILGLPSNSERDLVPGVNHFQWSSFENIPRTPRRTLAAAVPRLVPEGVDLLEQCSLLFQSKGFLQKQP